MDAAPSLDARPRTDGPGPASEDGMSATRLCSAAMLLAVLGGAARGQDALPLVPPTTSAAPTAISNPLVPATPAPAKADGPPPGAVATPWCSPWITYPQPPGCCGPVGGHGPISCELYSRYGLFFPLGNGLLKPSLSTGLGGQWGGRSLFFDADGVRAWTIDLGLTYQYYNGEDGAPQFQFETIVIDPNDPAQTPQRVPITANIAGYHRTAGHIAGGREWYLVGSVWDRTCGQRNWRAGADLGGRWATTHLDLNNLTSQQQFEVPAFERFHDVAGSIFLSVHTDVEFPFGGWLFLTGFRAEWEYQWSDILKRANQDSDFKTINLLWTLGLRF